jgi:hypothetical protein
MFYNKLLFLSSTFLLLIFFCSRVYSQQKRDTIARPKTFDSTSKKNILSLDTTTKKHNPKIATFRSAVLPGWGQAYNKKYWKIPIIYGALGTTAVVFFYNLSTYKKLRQAIIYRSDTDTSNDRLVDPEFIHLSTESIRSYRNSFRQNVDYSVLVFLIFWALNVVDATVDAHLKSFDVSNDISLKIKPGFNYISNTAGLSLVLSFKYKHLKTLPSLQ